MSIRIRFIALGAAFALCCLPSPSLAASWSDALRTLVILKDVAPGGMKEFVRLLDSEGGHASVVLSPRAAVVVATGEVLAKPVFSNWILEATQERIEPDRIGDRSQEAARAARVWNEFLAMRRSAPMETAPAHHPAGMAPDAGPIPVQLPPAPRDITRDAPTHIPYGAQYYDTSAYMAGSTAVGVWLLEAAGPTYDWSQAEEDQTLAGVVAGLDDWVGFGSTMAFLTFVLDIHTDVPVSGVPIENPQSTEQTWIGEALANAGWTGANAFERCFAYNNALRDAEETNWCYSIFIVDSDPNVNQGLFSTGGYAWAYYGGPWIYMSRFSTWAFNSQNYYEAVPMHESGHIYYATDEYDGVVQFNGYLNRDDNPSAAVFCIMNQNLDTWLCGNSKRQIAWRDADADGIMEPLDTEPACSLNPSLPDPTSDPTPTWTGRAQVTTIPNLNPSGPYFPQHAITVLTITNVECRVDGGIWLPATATDGTLDAYGEDYTFTSPPLTNGVHVVEARARNSAGNWTTLFASDTITVTGVVDAGDLAQVAGRLQLQTAGRNPGWSSGGVSVELPQVGWVKLDVLGVNGARVRTLFDGVQGSGRTDYFWNGVSDRGELVPAGVYFFRLSHGNEVRTQKFTLLR